MCAEAAAPSLPPAGDLEATSPVRLAYLAAASQATCRVEVALPAGPASVQYRRGVPEKVTHPAVELSEWLVAGGHVDPDAARRSREAAAAFGGFLGALFGQGLCDPGRLYPVLGEHATQSYQALLAEPAGPFRVTGGPPDPDAFPFAPRPLAPLVEAARSLPRDQLLARLDDRLGRPALKANVSPLPIEALALGPVELRLYPRFDGVHPLGKLAEAADEDGEALLRLAWLLGECDFLSFGDPAPAPRRATQAASDPAVARLQALRDRFAQLDHFAVLGLSRHCTDGDVTRALASAARRYHPDSAVDASPETKALMRDLFERVHAAYRVLSDRGSRRAYLEGLASEELEAGRPDESRRALDEVRRLVAEQRLEVASGRLEALIGERPQLAAAWAWYAWVKVLRAQERRRVQVEAQALLERAMKLDAGCGEVYTLAGRIARMYGDAAAAERHFTQARRLGEPGS